MDFIVLKKMVFIGLVNILLVIYSFGFVSADSQCALSPERALAAAKQLQTSLKKDGSYKVDIGYSKWFMTFNGMGPENPNGAYMEFSFPSSLMDVETGGEAGQFCDINVETCPEALPGQTQSVLMGSRDAILFLGCTPPPSRYFSFDMLVSSRFTDDDDYYYYPGCPFGDTKNNLNMANYDWASPFALVQTFNKKTAELIKSSLPSSLDINFDVHELNSTLLKLYDDKTKDYLSSQPDSLRPLLRWSVPDSPTDSEQVLAYQNQMWPVLYIRATENTPDHDDNLYKPIVTPRASNFSEVDKYKKKFASLSESVKSLLNSSHFKLTSTSDADNFFPGEMDDWGQVLNEWPEYEDGMGDYLNTRDAVYGNPGEEQELAPKGVAAMIGVKHTKLNMTVFNNAGISSLADTWAYAKWIDDVEMEKCGTFNNNSDYEDLWVAFFKREGTSFKCPSESCCYTIYGDDDGFPSADDQFPVLYGERSYLNPATHTGPAFDEILGIRVMTFDPA